MIYPFLFLGILLLAFIVAILTFKKAWEKGFVLGSLNFVLFEIKLPRVLDSLPRQEELSKLAFMEQFYNSLLGILRESRRGFFKHKPYIVLELAVPEEGEELGFYMATPRKFKNAIEKQIQAFFPQAELNQINDYNIFSSDGFTAASVLKLKNNYVLPFSTYKNLEADTLGVLATSLAQLQEKGEGAAIQFVIGPTSHTTKKDALKIINELRKGKNLDRILKSLRGNPFSFVGDVIEAFGTSKKVEPPEAKPESTPLVNDLVNAVAAKAQKNLFKVNIRILASAKTAQRSEEILSQIEDTASQFDWPEFNSFRAVRYKKPRLLKKLIYSFSFRLPDPDQTVWINSEELTSLFHFPLTKVETPKIKFLKSKNAPPPSVLPQGGVIIGNNIFRNVETKIRIDIQDRRRHFYAIGQTGTGKTTLLRNMIQQDIEAGNGVAVIDPHGDLVEAILSAIPENRMGDVILFDPADLERPIGLNMLEASTPQEKDLAVQEMISIFFKLFPPETLGPVFEHNMRNALLTLMADEVNPGTLVDIPRIFTDKNFVQKLLMKVTDPLVRNFWEQEMLKMTEQYKSEMLGYIISKVGRFVENSMMRNVMGQAHSGINLSEIMDQGKILLVSLSKGKLGEINSALLGLILVSKLQMAAFRRTNVAEELRRDFYLYIDEFQNFTTDSIASILSEARKYRLNLIVAHQFIAQLAPTIRDAIFGNVGSLASFRVGPDDAKFLVNHLAPVFSESDLTNIDNFHAYVKLLVSGATTMPFDIAIEKPKEGSLERAEKIREMVRAKYGRDRAAIEAEIAIRLGS